MIDAHCGAIGKENKGEINNASARGRLLFRYLSLFVMCKAWHKYNERPQVLVLLNLPQVEVVCRTNRK